MERRRREWRAVSAREQILRAAAGALAKKGLGGATIHDIAKEAGYAAPSLYRYFPDGKDEIVGDLLLLIEQELGAQFDTPLPAGLTFVQRLDFLLRRQAEVLEKWRDAFVVLSSPQTPTGRGRSRRSNRIMSRDPGAHVLRLTEWLERNASSAELGDHAPREAAYLLKGVLHAVFYQWLDGDLQGRLPEHAERVLGFFLHGLLGSAPAPPRSGARR